MDKAQSVAAQSYCLKKKKPADGNPDESSDGNDVY